MKLRNLGLIIHRWLGIVLGVIFLVIGVTGSALVFYREINSWLNPRLMQVLPQGESLDIEVLIKNVHSAFPNYPIHSIVFPRDPSGIYQMALALPQDEWLDVFLNPYTGAILGTQQWGHTLMSFIYSLHMSLLIKQGGDRLVGFCGLLLLVLAISGLVVWPGWRNWVFGLGMRWKAPAPLLNYDIHKVAGVFSALFLLLIAATGAGMVFTSEFQSLTYWLTNTPPITQPTSTAIANQAPPLSLANILRTAEASLPEGKTTLLLLPHDADGVFEVYKKLPQDIDYFGNSKVYIDRYSGKVLRVDNILTAPLAAKISNALLSLHNGTSGGLGMRCLYILIGLVPPILFITGIFIWRDRQRIKLYKTQK